MFHVDLMAMLDTGLALTLGTGFKFLLIIIIITCFFPVAVETLGPLSDEAHSLIAQSIRGKLRSCTNVFQWQFSVSRQCALLTRSQFPSPQPNHSGHTFFFC